MLVTIEHTEGKYGLVLIGRDGKILEHFDVLEDEAITEIEEIRSSGHKLYIHQIDLRPLCEAKSD